MNNDKTVHSVLLSGSDIKRIISELSKSKKQDEILDDKLVLYLSVFISKKSLDSLLGL